MLTDVTDAPTFTAQDRCDRCGAQAYVRVVVNVDKSALLFCAHHAREHSDRLETDAVRIELSHDIPA